MTGRVHQPLSTSEGDDHDSSSSLSRDVAASSPSSCISNIPSLVCAFSASATTGGTSYAFGLYANALKHDLNLSQGQLDSISTAFFVAGLFSWIPGLFSDTFGTKFAIVLGGTMMTVSLMSYWFVATQWIYVPHHSLVLVLSVLGVLIFLSCASVTGAVFKIISIATGPGSKGTAVGAAKGYVGLGAGLYACMFQSFKRSGESDLDFLPMAAFFAFLCATMPAVFLLPSKETLRQCSLQDDSTNKHFRTLLWSLVVMALLIVMNSMEELYKTSGKRQHDRHQSNATVMVSSEGFVMSDANTASGGFGFVGMLLLSIWLGPIFYLLFLPRQRREYSDGVVLIADDDSLSEVVGDEANKSADTSELNGIEKEAEASDALGERIERQLSDINDDEECGLLAADGIDSENRDESSSNHSEEPNSNMNLFNMIQTPSALLMLWTTTILVGAGTVETNNMGQMVESLGFPKAVTSASLALFSVAQAGGRVFTGALSESALNWNTKSFGIDNGVPRPFFLVAASVVGFVAHFLLGLAKSEVVFVIGATLAGAAFGMVWPLMVLITGEVFGTANVGANYMFFDGFTSAAGTLLMTKIIAQDIYDQHIDPNADNKNTCLGMACFQDTHMIVAGFSLTCIATSVAMMYTSRHVYNRSSLHAVHAHHH